MENVIEEIIEDTPLTEQKSVVVEAGLVPVSQSTFQILSNVDVSQHIEKKGKFNYLSWPWAVTYLKTYFPGATWKVHEYESADGILAPYMKTDCGYFVKVTVTVKGDALAQTHPVLDSRNRPIVEPDAFQVNTSIQRCLVKAIALHGLGLYIYAGEDLPMEPEDKNSLIEQIQQDSSEERINAFLEKEGKKTLEEVAIARLKKIATQLRKV